MRINERRYRGHDTKLSGTARQIRRKCRTHLFQEPGIHARAGHPPSLCKSSFAEARSSEYCRSGTNFDLLPQLPQFYSPLHDAMDAMKALVNPPVQIIVAENYRNFSVRETPLTMPTVPRLFAKRFRPAPTSSSIHTLTNRFASVLLPARVSGSTLIPSLQPGQLVDAVRVARTNALKLPLSSVSSGPRHGPCPK